jgi:hypothetical protein
MSHETSSDREPVAGKLPPRPDSETGRPFPPHGLSYLRPENKDEDPLSDPERETRLSYRPEPPPGYGRVLAWHRENRRGKATTAVVALAVLVLGALLLSLLDGGDFSIVTDFSKFWPAWAVLLVGALLIASPFTYLTYAAGADWLLVERSRWGVKKRVWLDLYNLTKIDASYGGTTFHLWLYSKGGGFSRSTEELQRDRRIWDLVYNGILHSVASGAQVSNQAIGILQLDKTPALKLRDARKRSDL